MSHIMLFGGAFDPPHNGHLEIAQQITSQHMADELWFVPCAQHPFGKNMSPAADRLAMLETAIDTSFNIDTYELDSQTIDYTIDTLQHFSAKNLDHTFSWLIGSDQLQNFHKWKQWKLLLSQHKVYVYPRQGFNFEPMYDGMIPLLNVPSISISSTTIRQLLSKNQDVSALLPNKTLAYIREHKLYQVE